ncbi:hypothetical protein OQX61_22445 [Pedobacter sp. PLR]|uniref:hypothetical protein n=1 Tax=Pedobacter sp. PLR TaxID=2994465 RepID=UPI0022473116|nr:hypothetical protein [Pedobacter sp. PLR]MCX2454046.1 hypothetical protein [Pedobacter sp. PLR]
MMADKLNYQVLFVKDTVLPAVFFIEELGLEMEEDLLVGGKMCPVLRMFNGHRLMLVKHEEKDPEVIVIYTQDCLRDFCNLKRQGFQMVSAPVYGKKGLTCEFYDPWGNLTLLLEERDYKDA